MLEDKCRTSGEGGRNVRRICNTLRLRHNKVHKEVRVAVMFLKNDIQLQETRGKSHRA